MGQFGFEEEPKLLMHYPFTASAAWAKGHFYAVKKPNQNQTKPK